MGGRKSIDPDALALRVSDGGNGRTFSNFGVIYRIAEMGKIFVVVIPAIETDPRFGNKETKLEFPGGSALSGEDNLMNLARELAAELQKGQQPVQIQSAEKFCTFIKPGDKDKGGGVHEQNFWAVTLKSQSFRDESEPTHIEPDGTVLGIPEFMDILEFLHSTNAKRSHKEAAKKFIEIASDPVKSKILSMPIDGVWEGVQYQYPLNSLP